MCRFNITRLELIFFLTEETFVNSVQLLIGTIFNLNWLFNILVKYKSNVHKVYSGVISHFKVLIILKIVCDGEENIIYRIGIEIMYKHMYVGTGL